MVLCCNTKSCVYLLVGIRNRVSTHARLLQWAYKRDSLCVYCRDCMESKDHLDFECDLIFPRAFRRKL